MITETKRNEERVKVQTPKFQVNDFTPKMALPDIFKDYLHRLCRHGGFYMKVVIRTCPKFALPFIKRFFRFDLP